LEPNRLQPSGGRRCRIDPGHGSLHRHPDGLRLVPLVAGRPVLRRPARLVSLAGRGGSGRAAAASAPDRITREPGDAKLAEVPEMGGEILRSAHAGVGACAGLASQVSSRSTMVAAIAPFDASGTFSSPCWPMIMTALAATSKPASARETS